ncbi:MAG TPA: YcxB family protein [Candidatus Bathyarchaeia archaeon]|nr:YcxB family protein [Candidatus Bathyarchaeia archaeon]
MSRPELSRAIRDISVSRFGKLWYVLCFLAVFFSASAIFFLIANIRGATERTPVNIFLCWLFLPVFMLYLYFVAPYVGARSSRKQSANLRDTMRYTISDEGVEQDCATARGEFQWATYLKAQETPDFFLLYVRRTMAHPIPKRAFASAEEISQFREMLRRHVKKVSLRG